MIFSKGAFGARNVGSVMFMTDQKEPDERGYRKVNRVVIDNLVVDVFGKSKGDIILPNDIIVNAEINSVIHLVSPYYHIDFIGGVHEYFSAKSGTVEVDVSVYFDTLFRDQIKQHFHRIYYRMTKGDRVGRDDLQSEMRDANIMLDSLLEELGADVCSISKFINVVKEVEQLKGN